MSCVQLIPYLTLHKTQYQNNVELANKKEYFYYTAIDCTYKHNLVIQNYCESKVLSKIILMVVIDYNQQFNKIICVCEKSRFPGYDIFMHKTLIYIGYEFRIFRCT